MSPNPTPRLCIILRGMPGAGKSELAAVLRGFSDAEIFEAEDYSQTKSGDYTYDPAKARLAHTLTQNQFRDAAASGASPLIVSNCALTETELVPYLSIASENDYRVFSLVVENRHGGHSEKITDLEKLRSMRERFSIQVAPDLTINSDVPTSERIWELAYAQFTPAEIIAALSIDPEQATEMFSDPESEWTKKYYEGREQAVFDIRSATFRMARQGSTPAITTALSLIEDRVIREQQERKPDSEPE